MTTSHNIQSVTAGERFYLIPLKQQCNHIILKITKISINSKTDEEIKLDVFLQLIVCSSCDEINFWVAINFF